MTKVTTINFPFTSRRIEMALLLLAAAIEEMQAKKARAGSSQEVAFYEQQIPAFQALADLLTKTEQGAGKNGATRKVRITDTQLFMLTGSIGQRNLKEVRETHEMEPGPERDKRLADHDEWAKFREALEAKDPRKYDTSQDAEEEEDEVEDSEGDSKD